MSTKLPRILVIDDEPRGVETFMRALRGVGTVRGASSAREALELLEAETFDVVLADQRMPDVTGVELLSRVAADAPETGRILVTGYSDINATIAAINQARVHAYLSKPCPPEQLQVTVRSVADHVRLVGENRRLLGELREQNERLEEARRAAEAANAAKSRFLASVSHEIRTPMTAILGYAEVLAEGPIQAAQEDALAAIQRSGEHLLRMINEILDFSRIEAGRFALEDEPVFLAELIRNLRETLTPSVREKGLGFSLGILPDTPPCIRADSMRLRQVLINLLENAIRYTHQGRVGLEVGFRHGELSLCVSDTGPGIPTDQIGRLFEPFNQLDSATSRRHGGVGLGLSICKRIVERMGGRITIDTEMGRGTSFLVSLPASALTLQPVEAKVAPPGRSLEGGRVLVADDCADNRRLIRHFLASAGAEVVTVEDGREALELLDGDPGAVDVVVMDMQMPEMDGYQATRLLRQAGSEVPVLALTAHALNEHRDECLKAGCTDYLSKPVSRSELVNVVGRLMDLGGKSRDRS